MRGRKNLVEVPLRLVEATGEVLSARLHRLVGLLEESSALLLSLEAPSQVLVLAELLLGQEERRGRRGEEREGGVEWSGP